MEVAPVLPTTEPSADPPSKVSTTRRLPAFSIVGLFGILVVALALTGLILNFILPLLWVGQEGAGGQTVDRDDFKDADFFRMDAYGKRLLEWPVAAFVVGMVLGLILFVLDFIRGLRVGVRRTLETFLLVTIAFAGFLLLLTGLRWLGFYFSWLMSDLWGLSLHLHVVPYLNLAFGLAFLGGSLFLLRRSVRDLLGTETSKGRFGSHAMRATALTVGVAAGGLLLMPLLPYAAVDVPGFTLLLFEFPDATFQFSEGYMYAATQSEEPEPNEIEGIRAAQALGWIRSMVWIVLYTSLALWFVALAERVLGDSFRMPFLLQTYGLNAAALLTAIVSVVLYYVHLARFARLEGVAISWNHFPPIVVAALLAAYGYYVVKVLVPFLRPKLAPH